MSSSSKLSKNEVEALISGLDGAEGDGSVSDKTAADKKVRDFQFGADDLSLLGDYYALRVINERFARFSRNVFQPMLKPMDIVIA